jgi:plasmid stabilization system protein ParE
VSRFILALHAQADLEAIWTHIAADNIEAADRWTERLYEAFVLLAKTPGIGHRRAELTPSPVLFWPVDNYLIIYRVEPPYIEIVAVTHGARDVPALLSRRNQ